MEIALLAVVTLICIWISVFDIMYYEIPLLANLLLMASGIGRALLLQENLLLVAIAAVAVYCILGVIRAVHFRARGVVGLGLGDVIFCSGATTWMRMDQIAVFIAIASFMGLIGHFFLRSSSSRSDFRIAFAPYLCASLLLVVYCNAFNLHIVTEETQYEFVF